MSSPSTQLTRSARGARAPDAGPDTSPVLFDRSLAARATSALVFANARYWTTVAPRVRSHLARWEQAAGAIPDPVLRELALGKLREERFNVEVAATFATLAPRSRRASAVEAIVALQVIYDYLDVLGEQPLTDPLSDGHRLFTAFTDAVDLQNEPHGEYYPYRSQSEDGGYLQALVATVRRAFTALPAVAAVAEDARRAAARCAEAQVLNHAASELGSAPLEQWAGAQTHGTGLQWRELLAGASASVLAVDALIAAAADPGTTPVDAAAIDACYLAIGALTMLDGVVDHADDLSTGQPGYFQGYEDPSLLGSRLAAIAANAVAHARLAPHTAHHVMTLVGVVAYYASAPGADTDFARPITKRVRAELRPLITPTFALMRAWRAAKRVRR